LRPQAAPLLVPVPDPLPLLLPELEPELELVGDPLLLLDDAPLLLLELEPAGPVVLFDPQPPDASASATAAPAPMDAKNSTCAFLMGKPYPFSNAFGIPFFTILMGCRIHRLLCVPRVLLCVGTRAGGRQEGAFRPKVR
jgi:hypothetical protein